MFNYHQLLILLVQLHRYRLHPLQLSDSWTEIEDAETERAGIFDTLFTSPDFVEPDERQRVYGYVESGQCDKVYSFAPAEHNRPVSLFLDRHAEELAFPTFSGVVQEPKVTW